MQRDKDIATSSSNEQVSRSNTYYIKVRLHTAVCRADLYAIYHDESLRVRE